MSRLAEEVFDDWAKVGRDAGMEEGHLPRAVQVLERMQCAAGTKILDLGCGNGWAARWIAAAGGGAGPVVAGIDASVDMVAKARSIDGPCVGFARGRFEALPFREACFAEIFSMEAIYYAMDLDAALAEIYRVLVPGGRVYLVLDYFLENTYSHSWPADLDVSMTLLGEADWQVRLEQQGFAVESRFRCLDSRPAPADVSDERRREIEDFRGKIGSLALIAQRPAGGR